MKEKDNIQNKDAVSASSSIDLLDGGQRESAKRKTSKLVKHEIENIHVEQELPNNGYFRLTISSLEIEWEE